MLVPVQKGAILAGFTWSQGPEIRWPRKNVKAGYIVGTQTSQLDGQLGSL